MFELDQAKTQGARIRVIGVGGSGCNAVNTMIRQGLEGVDFITLISYIDDITQGRPLEILPHIVQQAADAQKISISQSARADLQAKYAEAMAYAERLKKAEQEVREDVAQALRDVEGSFSGSAVLL